MKKKIFWIILLLLMLLLSACTMKPVGKEPTQAEQLAQSGDVCLGCEEQYVSGQLNADFGLCRECMVREGATYCQNCKTPDYARNMTNGFCDACGITTEVTTSMPAVSEEALCAGCGRDFDTSTFIGGLCKECRESTCRCTKCNQPYSPNQASNYLCFSCQDWSVPRCGFCGKDMTNEGGVSGVCNGCDDEKCDKCGAILTTQWDNNGLCDDCYAATQGCIKCGVEANEYDGYCYYCHPDFGYTCVLCGNGYPEHRPADEICPRCRCDRCGAILAVPYGKDGLCDDCYEDYCSPTY